MSLPSITNYGIVTGQFLVAVTDGNDPDALPETRPVEGSVTFTPSAGFFLAYTGEDNPYLILRDGITVSVDIEGYLIDPINGTRGVSLPATDDPMFVPVGWTWEAVYNFVDANGSPLRDLPRQHFSLVTNEVKDLVTHMPVPKANGVYITRGEQGEVGPIGPRGLKGDKGDPSTVPGPIGPIGLTGPEGPMGPEGTASTVPGPAGPAGPQGLTGPKGDKGDRGLQGETGIQGPIGLTGPTGPRGFTGDPGADSTVPGPAGPKGDTGDQGIQGIQGIQGPAGADGDGNLWFTSGTISTAPNGTFNGDLLLVANGDVYKWDSVSVSWILDKNIMGPKVSWYTGSVVPSSGFPSGTKVVGDFYLQGNGNVYTWNGSVWTLTTTNIKGSQGIQGIQGNTGSQGPRGVFWYTGTASPPTSATGSGKLVSDLYLNTSTGSYWQWDGVAWNLQGNLKGPIGATGPQGAASTVPGPTGPQGIQGPIGNTGPQGIQGDVGPQGPTGLQGEPGLPGADGVDGTNGTNGVDGVDGLSAYQIAVNNGFVGDEAAWLLSLEGTDGVDGADSTVPGPQGIPGETGPTGPAGADGIDGTNGVDGIDGADGLSAYEVAVANGFVGTEAEWLLSLKGEKGDTGDTGATGPAGSGSSNSYEVVVATAYFTQTTPQNFSRAGDLALLFDKTKYTGYASIHFRVSMMSNTVDDGAPLSARLCTVSGFTLTAVTGGTLTQTAPVRYTLYNLTSGNIAANLPAALTTFGIQMQSSTSGSTLYTAQIVVRYTAP